MALLLAVAAALVACSHAGNMMGMMDMMSQHQGGMQQGGMHQGGMQQGGQMMVPVGNGGCQQGADGRMPAGCEIPMNNVDIEEYMEQQMKDQQYANQEMAEKIKAQFEEMVKEVNSKKVRYAMSMVAEFTSACQCMGSGTTTYNAIFLQNAKTLNLTTPMDTWDSTRKPFEAKNEEEARALIFSGLLRSMCESVGAFMTFAQDVSNRIPAFRNGK